MAIAFHCSQCNKPLRVDEKHAGQKAKCPICGAQLEIPKALSPTDLPAPSEAASQDTLRPARQDHVDEPPDPWAMTRRYRTAKDATRKNHLVGISFLGLSVRTWIKLSIAFVIVGGVIIYLALPHKGVKVGKARIADCMVAMSEVRHPRAMEIIDATSTLNNISRSDTIYERSLLYEGNDSIVVLHDYAEAEYLLIPVTLSQKFLEQCGAAGKYTVEITRCHFALLAGGEKLAPKMMLVNSFEDFVRMDRKASYDMFGSMLGGLLGSTRSEPSGPEDWLSAYPCPVAPAPRDSGINVQFHDELDGRLMVMTWSDGCEAYRATETIEKPKEHFDTLMKVKVTLVFSRPRAGGKPMKLMAFKKELTEIPAKFGR